MTTRIGLIIPSSNRMVEQEMVAAFPADVVVHVTRLRMTGSNHVPPDELLPRIEEAARALLDARCDAVALHCTANSMEGGRAGEERILAALARAGAPQATTTITAIRRALEAVAARRVALITPYAASTTAHEAELLRQAGFAVPAARGFALAGSDAYCATPARFWYDAAMEMAHAEVDAFLISCANIAVLGVIADLEERLGRAVVTSNQAVIWDTLRLAGQRAAPQLGRLFTVEAGVAATAAE